MTLAPATRLGPYEILAPLGAGGMGEVYRARDTRLGREVAVKVLPDDALVDKTARMRLLREARLASKLNHPHICTIHEVDEADGQVYIAMELVEGQTLAKRLSGHSLSSEEVLRYGQQLADALSHAHEHGVVHRDFKSANVIITSEGRAKVLDFGLAKRLSLSGPFEASTLSHATLTEAGTVAGTPAYMAPEQLRGLAADERSDVWALGVVLYEMASGRRPFQGSTGIELISAIFSQEPPPLSVRAPLAAVIERCLAKEPGVRYQRGNEVRAALETVEAGRTPSPWPAWTYALARRRWLVFAAASVATVAVVLGLLLVIRLTRTGSPPASPLSLSLSFPVDAAPNTDNQNPLALTPDGKTFVYAGSKLFVRRLDRDEIRPIPGTEGALLPFISPDGLWVGFFAEGKLKKVSLAGGSPIILCDAPNPRGGSWGPDGTIVFTPSVKTGLWRIPASGGEPRSVTTPDAAKIERHVFPQILPGGEHVLFDLVDRNRISRAAVVSLRTGEQRILVEDAAYPRYLPTGHLAFTRPGTLFAVPFSLKRLETSGPPVPLLDDLVTNFTWLACAEYAFSQEGTLLYVPNRQLQRTLVWVDRKGAVERIPFPAGGYEVVALSPDGGRLAAITVDKNEKMALLFGDFARGTLSRSTAEGAFGPMVVWTPDGKRVAIAFGPGRKIVGVFWQSADGSTPPERLTSESTVQQEGPNSFSPDGNLLLVNVFNFSDPSPANTGWDIFVLPLSGERTLRPFLQTKFQEGEARFSPDGRWVAYRSNEPERDEVFVRPFPGPGPKWQISTEGGGEPCWSRSGRELFYRQGDKMMMVDVETKPTFRPGRPRTLFEGPFLDSYDVGADGTRFLMIKPDPAESGPAHVNVVLNWFEDVKRRVPGAK